MKLTFDPGVEAFRADFTRWLAQNAPTVEEIAAEPALGSAHLPGWARAWTRRMFDAGRERELRYHGNQASAGPILRPHEDGDCERNGREDE